MKRNLFLFLTCSFLLVTVFIWGCGGGGPGAPGSSGTEDTGVKLDATVIPQYLGDSAYSVDVFVDVCDEGPPPTYESYTDHTATLTIAAVRTNPHATILPGKLYVEKYTVEYRRSADSIGAPPIETDTRYKTIVIEPPVFVGTTFTEATVIFVDVLRKEQYRTDVESGRYNYGNYYINNYTALYTFEGKNEFGTKFRFKTQTDFQIGHFLYCD